MAAPMTLSAFVSNAVTTAIARGITDSEQLARLRTDAVDHWQSDLNESYSGAPRGSTAAN